MNNLKYNEDEFIENLLSPIDDIMQDVNFKVISIITNRIKEIGKLSPSDAQRLSIILKNKDLKDIEEIISIATNKSIKEIDSILNKSAENNDDLANYLYKSRNIPPTTYKTDLSLLNAVEVAKKTMVDDIVRFSNTSTFMINGKVTDIGKTYNYAVNRAVFEVQQGLFDFNTAMKSTVKQLSDSGLRYVEFETIMPNGQPYTRRLDSQVRMNLSDGIRQLNANYREIQGEQFQADKVFISFHFLVADDHAHINGKDYTLAEWQNVSDSLFRKVGTMNCRHYISYGIDGISQNPITEEERQNAIKSSNKQVTYTTRQRDSDGNFIKKTLPRYEASQVQRKLETEIRKLKDYKAQIDILGDETESKIVQKKISDKMKYYKSVSAQVGIQPKLERTRIVK